MTFCGIDCGMTGYISFIDKDVNIIDIIPIPVLKNESDLNIPAIIQIFSTYKDSIVFIEKQWARPKQSVSSGNKIVYCYGVLMGVCSAINGNVITDTPSCWQKYLKNLFLNNAESLAFKKDTLDYNFLLNNINNIELKNRFQQLIKMKSIKSSKIESFYLYCKIKEQFPHVDINHKNHNIIDAFLMSYVCAKVWKRHIA